MASDQPRSGAAFLVRHAEQVADDLDRNGGGEILDQVDTPFAFHLRKQTIDQFDQPNFHLGDGARRQRARDRAPHMGVQRRIVEHQARGVVLEQRRVAVFRKELDLLVRRIGLGVLVERLAIVVPGDEIAAVRHAMHRIMLAQGAIIGIRIVDEIGRQALQVESARGIRRLARIGKSGHPAHPFFDAALAHRRTRPLSIAPASRRRCAVTRKVTSWSHAGRPGKRMADDIDGTDQDCPKAASGDSEIARAPAGQRRAASARRFPALSAQRGGEPGLAGAVENLCRTLRHRRAGMARTGDARRVREHDRQGDRRAQPHAQDQGVARGGAARKAQMAGAAGQPLGPSRILSVADAGRPRDLRRTRRRARSTLPATSSRPSIRPTVPPSRVRCNR